VSDELQKAQAAARRAVTVACKALRAAGCDKETKSLASAFKACQEAEAAELRALLNEWIQEHRDRERQQFFARRGLLVDPPRRR
jgi:uncharacterized protein (DUF305 family)